MAGRVPVLAPSTSGHPDDRHEDQSSSQKHHKKKRRSGGRRFSSSQTYSYEIEAVGDFIDYEDEKMDNQRQKDNSRRHKRSSRSSRGNNHDSSRDIMETNSPPQKRRSSSRRTFSRKNGKNGPGEVLDRRAKMLNQRASKRYQTSKDLKQSKRKIKQKKKRSSKSSSRHILSSKDIRMSAAERLQYMDKSSKMSMVSMLVQEMRQDDLDVVGKILDHKHPKAGDMEHERRPYFKRLYSCFQALSTKKKYALVAFLTFTVTVVIAGCVVVFGFAQGAINAADSGFQSNKPVLDVIKFSPLLTGNLTIGTLPEGQADDFYLNIKSVNFSIFDEEDLVLYITRGDNDTLVETRQSRTHFRFQKIALLRMPIKLPFDFFPGEYNAIILSDENEDTQRRIELVQSLLETIDEERDAMQPSGAPTSSKAPTNRPSLSPTERPSFSPTRFPTLRPSHVPSMVPSISPSTSQPSDMPTNYPTITPRPTTLASDRPTNLPSQNPTADSRLTRLEEVLVETLGSFPNPTTSSSPQAKAVKWLAEGGPGSNLNIKGPVQNILQHFAVLVQWYSTSPNGWTSNITVVDPSKALCDWEGVKCNVTKQGVGEEEVVELDWPKINMQGSLATELGFLTSLTVLDFHDNNLQGSIPTELEALTGLKNFDLGSNQLTGALPDLSNNQGVLQKMDLGKNNGLSGNLESYISSLPRSLREFSCESCQLGGTLPIELRSLQALEKLELGGAGIEGRIPSNLAQLPQLMELDLHGNKLTGKIHPRLGTMAKLEKLDFSNNLLSGSIISDLSNLPSLRRLNLKGNALGGYIPVTILSMQSLNELDLSNNQIVGNLPRFSGRSLVSVKLNNSPGITGDLGVIFGSSTDGLVEFECSQCKLTGNKFPKSVRSLNLRQTGISGPITRYMNQLRLVNLTSLDLGYNALTGQIPNSLVSSSTIRTVRLNNNLLSGAIPSLANGAKLSIVDFSNNNGLFGDTFSLFNSLGPFVTRFSCSNCTLGGTLTDDMMTSFPNIEVLELERTGLGGSIPNSLGTLSSLVYLDLRKNTMTGTVPSLLAASFKIKKLLLGKNRLTASLASFTGSSLEELSLEDNLLISGNLNSFFSSVSKTLTDFNCDMCRVPGSLPGVLLQKLPNLKVLKLVQTGITGSIPTQLGRLLQLSTLDLGKNVLVGTIPEAIADLESLKELDLSNNLLEGDIPVFSSIFLSVINLNDNIGLRGRVDAFLESFPAQTMKEIECEDCILEGTLPQSVSRFKNLETLRLDKGGIIGGNLPTQFGSLSKLRKLDVSGNVITGVLPAEIRNLQNLEELDVGENFLRNSIPAFLGDMSSLEELKLGSNLFTGTIPPNIGRLPSMKHIDLSGNDLLGPIPAFTGKFIQSFDLSKNDDLEGKLEYIFGNLTDAIISFACEDCELLGSIPANPLAAKSNLRLLNLEDCDLVGSIPGAFSRLVNLTSLNLAENSLVGRVPTQLLQLSKLEVLDVYDNLLTGSIPTFKSLSNLQELDLGKNTFAIDAFSVFDTLPISLRKLYFDETPLSGTLPYTGIQAFTSLEDFWVQDCDLYGRLPLFNGLSNMTSLRLGNNKLSGTIPASYGQLPKLQVLDLSSNDIIGNIPSFINARSLLEVDFSFNTAIVGNPSRLLMGLPESIQDLRCQVCGLTGGIPGSSLLKFKNLTGVHLEENTLTGQLPTQFGSLVKLSRLSLGGNAIVGSIPTQIANLPRLEIFDLWGNQLTGTVPSFSENDGFLNYFDIEDNQIVGPLQDVIQALPPESLEKFYAGMNQIIGSIPPVVASYPRLSVFDIQFAAVGGTVPAQMSFMNQLVELQIEGNAIGGVFPTSIANLPNLLSLGIHSNVFSGSLDPVCGRSRPADFEMTADCGNPVLVPCSCCSNCWSKSTGGFVVS